MHSMYMYSNAACSVFGQHTSRQSCAYLEAVTQQLWQQLPGLQMLAGELWQ